MKSKPYPRRCASCCEVSVQLAKIQHKISKKHDGKLYELLIEDFPVDKCTSCGEVFFTNASSDFEVHSLREHLGLLQPAELKELLAQHKLTQREFAQHIHVAEESVSRWINSLSIQSRSLDRLMRLYFTFPQVRKLLASGDSIAPGSVNSNPSVVITHGTNVVNMNYEAAAVESIFGRKFSQATIVRRSRFKLVAGESPRQPCM